MGGAAGSPVTVHGALHHAARHPAGKIAVACIQPVYTPFRSVLNKRRWRLGPPSGDFSMGWMRYSSRPAMNCNGRRAGEEEVRKNGSLKKEKEKICRKYVKNL